MESLAKRKLKRRGNELYNRYFYNPEIVIEQLINQIDSKETIDENICETIFNVSENYMTKVYELITYYPKKLKELKLITNNVIDEIYSVYGETINIMKESSIKTRFNVRGKLTASAMQRAKEQNIPCEINSEDVILVKNCIFLDVPIEYGNNVLSDYSASLDKIIPSKGYIKGNIQVISHLANCMKSSANIEQLLIFSKNVIKQYK